MNDNQQIQPGDVTVVKLGGSIFEQRDTTITDVIRLQQQGVPLVLIHGGANMVTKWLSNNNNKTNFHQGERVTDQSALEMVTAVLGGLVNKEIVAAINVGGGRAVGISGVDGDLIKGKIRDEKMGYVGQVVEVDSAVIMSLLNAGFIPVIAPVSLHACERPDDAPLLLNINGDTVAGEIAAALEVDKLILLTDVEGIRDQSGSVLTQLSPAEAKELLDSGVAYGGMIPKINSCLRALSNDKTCCIIVDGRQQHALFNAVTTGCGGTTIRPV